MCGLLGIYWQKVLTRIALTRMRGLDPKTSFEYVKSLPPTNPPDMNFIRVTATAHS